MRKIYLKSIERLVSEGLLTQDESGNCYTTDISSDHLGVPANMAKGWPVFKPVELLEEDGNYLEVQFSSGERWNILKEWTNYDREW